MPLDFVTSVEEGLRHLGSGGWLTPASVHGLSDADFVSQPAAQREEIFRLADEFRAVAEAVPNVDAAQEAAARAALERLGDLLRPYRTAESRAIGDAIWKVWGAERNWIPTFDYQLGQDSTGDPAVWVWLILSDDKDILNAKTREEVSRIRTRLHADLQDAGVNRWPFVRTRLWSEATGPNSRVPV